MASRGGRQAGSAKDAGGGADCRLYLITPPAIEIVAFGESLKAALGAGDIACLQLRLKGVPDDEVLRAAEHLLPICVAHDVAFLVNDRPDLAARAGADGVHVGQEDATYAEARAVMGKDAIVGVTCHDSRHLAIEAGEAGADYVAFGAFFPTTTKDPKAQAGLDIIEWWSGLMTVPCVAIGGITPQNCAPLVEAGADFLATSAAVWANADGPAAAIAAFARVIDESFGND